MRVLEELARRAAAGETTALATVVETEGSTPAKGSMRMLVGAEGRITGTVGGGHTEASIEEAAKAVLETGQHQLLSFTFDDDMADEGGLICGGTIRVLVERVKPPATWAGEAVALYDSGKRGALLARVSDTVEREVVTGSYVTAHTTGPDGDTVEAFDEPISRPRCILLGAGHVGRAVARIAREAGFVVAVVEDREDQAKLIEADQVIVRPGLADGLKQLAPMEDDFVVVMTRGTGLDLACVRAGLSSPARYVGLLASRKKRDRIVEALAAEGVDAKSLHAPVGLDLGASSAGEIAVSVVAQLIKVRRLGRGDR